MSCLEEKLYRRMIEQENTTVKFILIKMVDSLITIWWKTGNVKKKKQQSIELNVDN